MFGPLSRSHDRRATVLMYTLVGMTAFVGFVSLAVDGARVRVVKSQLQQAADAASRYAAAGLSSGTTTAQNNAVTAAADNTADGSSVVLDKNNDIEFGAYDLSHRTFTKLTGASIAAANAVRVTARRTSASGNPVSLYFGKAIGAATCDVSASSVAVTSSPVNGFIGLNGVTLQSYSLIGSYDSSSFAAPSKSSAFTQGLIGSNGTISTNSYTTVKGDVLLGPGGNYVPGLFATLTGTTQVLTAPLVYADPDPGSLATTNSNSQLSGTSSQGHPLLTGPSWKPDFHLPTQGDSATIPGGSYYLRSFKTGNNVIVNFTGPTTLFIDGGDFDLGSMSLIITSGFRPGNLKIYQRGGGNFNMLNVSLLEADVYAPSSPLSIGNMVLMAGRGVWSQISVSNNAVGGAAFLYDTSLSGSQNRIVSLVQ